MIRRTYQTEAAAEDITDDNGKVTATDITFWDSAKRATMVAHMFRTKATCEDYAKEHRIDTKKYE